MKIAIVCDWLVTLGGAENVLGELLHCFPHADLFAVVDFLEKNQRDLICQKKTTTTFIQKMPFARRKYRSYLPLMPLAIEQLDLSAYDLIISNTHAVAKGVITGPDQLHISYTHTPMRYAWDLQHQYLQESGLHQKWSGFIARYFLHKLRLWDARSAQGVDHFVANSNYIARRILKTYRREATTIYPPVDVTQFTPHHHKEAFYVTASRFVPYKKIDLIVESFRALPDKQLIVIGDGPDRKKIQAKAGKNVTLLGHQPKQVLVDYLQRATGFIFAAEEDFGILPLEAQACGTPVIAYGKGGALETVRDLSHEHPTGLFFTKQHVDAICASIHHFEENRHRFTVDHCTKNAAQFAIPIFRETFKQFVLDRWMQFQSR